jgi:hypothetical protein
LGNNNKNFALIREANNKVHLIDILRHYGFKIEQNYQRPEWSNNLVCPLKSHKGAKERTPSFGYCFQRDYFHCFGCQATGRAVEFISLYEQVPRYVVANRILLQFEDNISIQDFNYEDNITPILLDGSKFLQEQIQKNKNNPDMLNNINKLIWWIDCFLMDKVSSQSIKVEELVYRLNRVKELLT